MRPCTPTQDAPAPRESAIKPVPHPAAPVGEPSQTRRHHLTPTPVQQLCTRGAKLRPKRLFLLYRARRVLFLALTKREWGRICTAVSMADIPRRNRSLPF